MTLTNRGKGINYTLMKPSLEKAIQERKSTQQISELLDINYKTAWKYRARYMKERGEMNAELAGELRNEWIAKTQKDLELAETIALKHVVEGKTPKEQENGINILIAVKKEIREFLESAGVISKQPDTQINNVVQNNVKYATIWDLKKLQDEYDAKRKAITAKDIIINPEVKP